MIQSILSNLAIILLGHLFMSLLIDRKKRFSELVFSICVVTLFSAVIISMFYLPIDIDGFKFDLRLIPIIYLAIFRGWKLTLPTLIIVCTWRYFMGGVGMMPGIIAGMAIPTLFVLLYCTFKKNARKFYDQVIILTVCWLISDFPIVFIIPNGWEVFKGFFLIRYTSFLVVAFIYYLFIKAEYRKLYYKEQLERMAWHDQLTGLFNRRKFIELVETKRERPLKKQFIALIDIDHFKKVNDTYGHMVGDHVLTELAAVFDRYKDERMIFARYGGEEFVVFLEAHSIEEAIRLLERLREGVKNTVFEVDEKEFIRVTISLGAAQLIKDVLLKDIIHLADQNLYKAKEQGRDQLVYDFEYTFN